MSPPSDDHLDYLLSRGRLGGSQRDRILRAALGASRDTIAAFWRRRIVWTAGGLAVATCALLLLVTLCPSREESAAAFQSKGPGDAPLIAMSCLGGQLEGCTTGSKLAFAVDGGRDKGGFLTSYGEPTASPPGTYRVRTVLSRRPIAREALAKLASADTLARVDLELVVVPR
jgi:hypothetical protein